MSVLELKRSVLALPERERQKFVHWLLNAGTKRATAKKVSSGPLSDDDIVAMTATAWAELDQREAEDKKRKTRRSVAR